MDSYDFSGKTAIVTGAAGGLGSAMALALSNAGATVVAMDVSEEYLAKRYDDAVTKHQISIHPFCGDIGDYDSVKKTISFAKKFNGRIDILVNNAGIGPAIMEASPYTKSMRFWEADRDVWLETLRINVCGTYNMSREVTPIMIDQHWGRIINVSTSLVTMQRSLGSPYGVSKAAIEAETLIWAKDLDGSGVTVNSLLPGGAVDTNFLPDDARRKAASGEMVLLQPIIMVNPLLWLCSSIADNVSGKRFVANRWNSNAPTEAAAFESEEPFFPYS